MNKKIFIILKYIIFLALFLHIHLTNFSNYLVKASFFLLVIFLLVNDYLRRTKFFTYKKSIYYLSIFLTMIGAVVLRYFLIGPETVAYLFFILVEITAIRGKKFYILSFLHFLTFSILLFLDMGFPHNFQDFSNEFGILLSYCTIAYISYSLNAINREKERVNQLNDELKTTNIKLQQYAWQIEELTITKERSELAQELHDSVGHSLMALAMHLEFAKRLCDMQPEKVKDVIAKSEVITKNCIADLRQCFDLLKEEKKIKCFYTEVKNIFKNFTMINNIKFNFKASDNLNSLSQTIQKSLYRTIKESITNSIKHGKATEISIEIYIKESFVILRMKDNGIGCNKIIKSNGLSGIEKRTTSLNGKVDYFTSDGEGFEIKINIPLLMEGEKYNDKGCVS